MVFQSAISDPFGYHFVIASLFTELPWLIDTCAYQCCFISVRASIDRDVISLLLVLKLNWWVVSGSKCDIITNCNNDNRRKPLLGSAGVRCCYLLAEANNKQSAGLKLSCKNLTPVQGSSGGNDIGSVCGDHGLKLWQSRPHGIWQWWLNDTIHAQWGLKHVSSLINIFNIPFISLVASLSNLYIPS